jgi:hypothetical protein
MNEKSTTPAPIEPKRYGSEAEQRAWMYVTLGLSVPAPVEPKNEGPELLHLVRALGLDVTDKAAQS